jgi:hypothetical protein
MLNPESRRQYFDNIIDTLRAKELNAGPTLISDFDKARLFSSLGLLLHDGLSANATGDKRPNRSVSTGKPRFTIREC